MKGRRILILTASFGDGHNSAAQGLAEALRREGGGAVRVEVRDLIRERMPLAGKSLEWLYRFAITHAPWAWRQFYRAADRLPLESDPAHALQPLAAALAVEVRKEPPAAIVATFPLYPHLLRKVLGDAGPPVHTVVTDSITIHPVWRADVARTYFAADETSAAVLRRMVLPRAEVIDSGFPVDPLFAELPVEPAGVEPKKVLFFPAASAEVVRRALRSLLRNGPPDCAFTLALGRHAQRLGGVVEEIRREFPARVLTPLGWTSGVPELMTRHDLIIAKAGGATTHECSAAGRPVIITKVVPGQEEGNAELVQRRGSGVQEENPGELGPLLSRLAGGREWLALRDAAWRHRRAKGALAIARHVLASLEGGPA